jgi:hypothetical protein
VSRSCRHTQVMLQTVTLFYIHCVVSGQTEFLSCFFLTHIVSQAAVFYQQHNVLGGDLALSRAFLAAHHLEESITFCTLNLLNVSQFFFERKYISPRCNACHAGLCILRMLSCASHIMLRELLTQKSGKTRLKILPVLTREHYTRLLH